MRFIRIIKSALIQVRRRRPGCLTYVLGLISWSGSCGCMSSFQIWISSHRSSVVTSRRASEGLIASTGRYYSITKK